MPSQEAVDEQKKLYQSLKKNVVNRGSRFYLLMLNNLYF